MICNIFPFFNISLMGLLTRSWNLIAMTYVHSAPLLTRQRQCTIINRFKLKNKTTHWVDYMYTFFEFMFESTIEMKCQTIFKKIHHWVTKICWCEMCISMNLSILTLIIIHVCNVRQGTVIYLHLLYLRKMYLNFFSEI